MGRGAPASGGGGEGGGDGGHDIARAACLLVPPRRNLAVGSYTQLRPLFHFILASFSLSAAATAAEMDSIQKIYDTYN